MDRLEHDLRTTLRDPHRELPTDLVSLDSVYAGSARRHRRRVAAVSASAVVVALLVAVPVALQSTGTSRGLDPTDPSTTNAPVTPSPTPTTDRSTSPSPQESDAQRSSWGNAKPLSVTAIDVDTFFVLGHVPGLLGVPSFALVRTDDGGRTFAGLRLPADRQNGPFSPETVRFGSAQDGWLVDGRTLFATHDGANAWSSIPMTGDILRLEAAAGTVWAIVSRGSSNDVTLWRSPVGTDDWSQVNLPRELQGPVDLALQGRRVHVLGADTWLVSDDGSRFVARNSPCGSVLGGSLSASADAVWFVCANGTSGTVYLSPGLDGGFETVPSTFPDALPSRTVVGARSKEAAVLGVPGDGGLVGVSSTGERLSSYPGGTGWTYVGFTTPDVGYGITGGSVTQLLRTSDGGAHWAEVKIR